MQNLALFLRLNNNKYGEGFMDRLSYTESDVSATCERWLNKSYYEPFPGFAYCVLVIIIVDMQNKKQNEKKERSWEVNTLH